MSRGAKPTLGYPSRTAAVLALRAEGQSPDAIAERIGISKGTVAALTSIGSLRQAAAEGCHRTVLVSIETLTALHDHAAKRGVHINMLARLIIETVVDDNLVDAVLDDRETRP